LCGEVVVLVEELVSTLVVCRREEHESGIWNMKGLVKPKAVNEVDVVNRLPRLALPLRRRAQHRQRALEEE
jgi:hypothetical protein